MDTIQSSARFLTGQTMYPLVEEFLQSGLSQKTFCTERGLSYHGFQYWIRKYREQQHPSEKNPENPKAFGFIPVKLKQQSSGSSAVEIEYPDGTKIRFAENAAADHIRKFIPFLSR